MSHSTISLSSGYCSDDDVEETAAVRQGRDCWMASPVVPAKNIAAVKRKRRQRHGRRGLEVDRDSRRNREHDPFRIFDDSFLSCDDASAILPPLQVDPQLLECDSHYTIVAETCFLRTAADTASVVLSNENVSSCNWNSPHNKSVSDEGDVAVVGSSSMQFCHEFGGRLLAEMLLGVTNYRSCLAAPDTSRCGDVCGETAIDCFHGLDAKQKASESFEPPTEFLGPFEAALEDVVNICQPAGRELRDSSVQVTRKRTHFNGNHGCEDKPTSSVNGVKLMKLNASCRDDRVTRRNITLPQTAARESGDNVIRKILSIDSQPTTLSAVTSCADNETVEIGGATSDGMSSINRISNGLGSAVLEAMLRTAVRFDANKGSDSASASIQDGLHNVFNESSTTAQKKIPSLDQEPSLLHRLLTGQGDETAFVRVEACDTGKSRDCLLSMTSAFDELSSISRDEMTQFVGDISASVGLEENLLDDYLPDLDFWMNVER